MKRPRSPSAVPDDPVLAQLDALINGAAAEPPPTKAAIVAASDSFVFLLPSDPMKRWKRPRLRGVVAAAISQADATKRRTHKGC